MRKNLFIALAVLTGLVISMTACDRLGDIDALEHKALKDNLRLTTVNIAAIQGVTAPTTGGIPVRNIVANDQYTGTVTWLPAPGSTGFTYGTRYTATITLTPKDGYTLHTVKANFFTVTGATATNSANSGVIKAVFPPATISAINIAAIQGLTVPVTGQTPVTRITENAQYTGTVTWSPTVSGTFSSATQYTATITLTPKTGYTLQGVVANFFTVAGATATNSVNSGVITVVFPPTASTVINIAAIQGVTAPVTGGTPVTSITENAQYTGTVTWSPTVSGTFVFYTQYTATITLTAKTGYTLQGVTANFFTFAGADSVTNSANSGVIRAVFPTTARLVEMIQIPGGSFEMGSDSGESDEKPVHTVTLSGFYMGKYEVTQEQWTAVMGNNPSYFTSSPASGEVQNKRPVEQVSWYDALVFCNKLSMREGLSPAYRISGSTDPSDWGTVPKSSNSTWNAVVIVAGSTGYRLPTEAQWEYAARGGNGSPGNYTYSGSNTVGGVAWYSDNSGNKTHEVGKKAPNGLGLYDMSGNVWEWCWGWYGSYPSGTQTNPEGADSGSYPVIRGGCWEDPAVNTRSAIRVSRIPDYGSYHFGFRLVRP